MPDHTTSTDPLSHKQTTSSEPLPNGQATTSNLLSVGKKLILDNAPSALIQPYFLDCTVLSAENLPLVLQRLRPDPAKPSAKNDPINLKLLQLHCLPTDLLNNLLSTIASLDIQNLYFDLESHHFDPEALLTKRASKIINNTTIISPAVFNAFRQLVQRNRVKEIYFIVPDQFNISTHLLTEEQERLLIGDLEKNHTLISLSLLQRSIALSNLDRFNKYEIKWYSPDNINNLISSPEPAGSISFTRFENAINTANIDQAAYSITELYSAVDNIFKTNSCIEKINTCFCQLIMHPNFSKQHLQQLAPYKKKIITYLLQIRENISIPINGTLYPSTELLELFTSSGNAYEFFGDSTNQLDKLWFKNNSVRNNNSDSIDALRRLLKEFYPSEDKPGGKLEQRIIELKNLLYAELTKQPLDIPTAQKFLSIIDKTYACATEEIIRDFYLACAKQHISSLLHEKEKTPTSTNPTEPSIEEKATQALIGAIESIEPNTNENKKFGFEKIIPLFLALIEKLTPNISRELEEAKPNKIPNNKKLKSDPSSYEELRKVRRSIFEYLKYGLSIQQSDIQLLSGNLISHQDLLNQLLDTKNHAGNFFVRETFLSFVSTYRLDYIAEFNKIRRSWQPTTSPPSPPVKNAADLSSVCLLTKL